MVVDRDVTEVRELSRILTNAGHEVASVTSGELALRAVRERRPDLLLIDPALPDLTGSEVCRTLRADPVLGRLPIIVLSESDDEIDRVVAFEVGADDFVTKPYSHRELVLRVRAILRRRRRNDELEGPASVGALEIDPAAHRVAVGNVEIILSALEFKLLATLYQRRDRVQTREVLLEEVWGGADGVGLRTVDACVKRLRQKLGSAGALVETVRGVGYRFVASEGLSSRAG